MGFVLKNVQGEIDMQINFRNTLVNQNDPKLAKIFSISQKEIKDRNDDNVENYSRPIEELKYFLTKDYARTYINLKNIGREERIRTSDPITPSDVRYQAALLPELFFDYGSY